MPLSSPSSSFFSYGTPRNPLVFPETLAHLAKDGDADVRSAVAANPKTPGDALSLLARDADDDVRWSLCRNIAAPTKALESLTEDPNEWIAHYALEAIAKTAVRQRIRLRREEQV